MWACKAPSEARTYSDEWRHSALLLFTASWKYSPEACREVDAMMQLILLSWKAACCENTIKTNAVCRVKKSCHVYRFKSEVVWSYLFLLQKQRSLIISPHAELMVLMRPTSVLVCVPAFTVPQNNSIESAYLINCSSKSQTCSSKMDETDASQNFIWILLQRDRLLSLPCTQRGDSRKWSPLLFSLPEVVHQSGFSHTHTLTMTFLSKDRCSHMKEGRLFSQS